MNLREIREKKGTTQLEIATQMNVSQQAVAKWETDNALPRADKLVQLAEILGCTVDELLRG